MDIVALGEGGFGITLCQRETWKYLSHKDGSLSLWATDGKEHVSVSTYSGIFVETVDEKGSVVQEGGDGQWFVARLGKEPVRLRHKALPDPALSKTQLNKARKTVTRYLVSGSPEIPSPLTSAIKWLEGKLAKIPAACRRSAHINFGTRMEYGETYADLEITYSEPETDEEVIHRVQIERERAKRDEAAERRQLGLLKAKFG